MIPIPLVVGWKQNAEREWAGVGRCPNCGPEQEFVGYRLVRKVGVYFLPKVIPIRTDWIAQCQTCGTSWWMKRKVFEVAKDRAHQGLDIWAQL